MTSDRLEELLYDSERTRVTRIRAADGSGTVSKQPLGPGAPERLRTEVAALRRLTGVPGTPQLAGDGDGVLRLRDTSGRTVADSPGPWPVDRLVDLAHRLALVLADVHRHGVIHRDVSPANILVGETGEPTLIDFELAALTVQDHHCTVPEDGLAGTLPYLAPEQTGRTGRPVDHRADLYALGATLYELATGAPPFGRDGDRDPLSLIHDHLARVPVPPAEVNPQFPAMLSRIVMRLLEKEPDRRYQSGEGLAHDLTLLRLGGLDVLGSRDFPLRLAPPATLIGRDAPLAALHALLAGTVAGHSALALITGPAGVGKTSLADRLRPAVEAAGGWFVAGKFDQFRRDVGGDAVRQAFDLLGSQLLSEPEEVVAQLRTRLRDALGPNTALFATLSPPFRALLGVPGEEPLTDDPRALFARIRLATSAVLRTVASGASPVVLFIDDLQWAAGAAFQFLDDVLDQPDVPGLLVLGACREEQIDRAHPLAALLDRLRHERGDAGEIRLANLGPDDLPRLVAEMLRLPVTEAAPLAAVLAGRTGGNPFDTVELINALRREGTLVPEGTGWRWDDAAVRRFVGHGDVPALLGARIAALPAEAGEMLDMMAGLGGEVDLDQLGVAAARDADEVTAALRPAADDELVTVGARTARFRHDRIHQAAFGRLAADERARLSLTLARRLAADPAHALAAAPQYLAAGAAMAVPGISVEGEERTATALMRRAANAARLVANHAGAELYLAASLRLLSPDDPAYDDTRAEWHSALCALGRFEAADREFGQLSKGDHDPIWFAGPVAEQIGALTNRRLLAEALALGIDLLGALGIDVPDPERMGPEIGTGLAAFYAWLAHHDDGGNHPELSDERLLAVAHLLNRMTPAAFFADQRLMAWLVAQAARIWAGHGVSAALVGTIGNIGIITISSGGEYRAAYDALRVIIAAGEKHGYEPEVSQVRFLHALAGVPWFEPLDNGVRLAHQARDGLLRGGDLRSAFYTYYASVPQMLGSAPDLEAFAREAEAGQAFGQRIGAEYETSMFVVGQRLVRVLRGTEVSLGEHPELAGNDAASAFFVVSKALAAAITGDDDALARHSATAVGLLPTIPGVYLQAPAHLLAVLGAAVRAQRSGDAGREAALNDLDRSRDFLAGRALDQPGNYRHLHRFAEATRAAVLGDFQAAAVAYDAALQDASATAQSWHAPLIAERAARFYLANGLEHVGDRLLAEALQGYARWGATGKVHDLKRAYPSLGSRLAGPATPRAATLDSLSTEVIDLMAVLEAARVLSSETDLDSLRARVQHVLKAMTGATAVRVVLWDPAVDGWVFDDEGGLPLTAIRHAERTREPLLVDDVTLDGRVSRDPYLAGLDNCSLLVVPVIGQGRPRAMLVLENRLTRRAFSAGRLDAVQLIAGQLTVSLENAQVYASLERKVAERTEALAEANRRLELLTVTDPLTGLPNRRKLTTFLDAEWLRSKRSQEPIGVAMVDIDQFKKYNDHFGHQGGDNCLRLVADALRDSVRVTDLVARYGGEEFCIVMPGANEENAMVVAERACRAVSRLREPHPVADDAIVTVSVGVTSANPAGASSPEELIKLADEALYAAKRAGRNRVVSGP
ncbi:serine/threonine protein kinase [Actinoplanes cyaneus]|uniref:Serine/threonine protein kinase n=1 Tax=Actinoplanes cyaneus TaxID=52696 RepID=A0A919IS72_9ACTN|nr:diguanylate cyclase [Actinoplanes cyaneus]MCW2141029.1 diguanylate cyclase (GGDEF) domain-containing protein [Actinoplanes cyaneus]GID67090.1 serine/threonine protein kinase [Actinoplanes cyaneus]